MNRNIGQNPWQFRRNLVVCSLIFNAGCILYVMIHGAQEAETGRTIVSGCFDSAMLVINGYIFGAVWHDKNNKAKGDQNVNTPAE